MLLILCPLDKLLYLFYYLKKYIDMYITECELSFISILYCSVVDLQCHIVQCHSVQQSESVIQTHNIHYLLDSFPI